MLKKLLLPLAVAAVAGSAYAQSALTTRVFTYDGTVATNGTSIFEIDQVPANTGTLAVTFNNGGTIDNSITAASVTGATFGVKTTINVRTYVYVEGNFSGTFFVRGPGTNTSSNENNDIVVRTNRPMTFTAANFTELDDNTVGSIDYTMRLGTGSPFGTQFAIAGPETDTDFNGEAVSSTMADLSTAGVMTLRLQRQLTLNQLAMGATQYTATGEIVMTVN
ncbi:MAG: hypothetical protein ACK4XJ_05340 [Fimbriimonadaceae bacterium]